MNEEPKSPQGKHLYRAGLGYDHPAVQLADAYWQLRMLWQKKLAAKSYKEADDIESDMTDVVLKIQTLEAQLK